MPFQWMSALIFMSSQNFMSNLLIFVQWMSALIFMRNSLQPSGINKSDSVLVFKNNIFMSSQNQSDFLHSDMLFQRVVGWLRLGWLKIP